MAKYLEKKRWELEKLVMFILLIAFPIIGAGVVWLRDWNTLQTSRVGNVSLDVICMIILLLLFTNTVKDRNDLSLRTACFAGLILLNSLELLLDLISWCVDEIPRFRGINIGVNTAYYFFSTIMIMVFWQYLVELSGSDDPRLIKLTKFLIIAGAISEAAVLLNLVGKYYFDVNADGVYHRTSFYLGSQLFMILMIICVVQMIRKMNLARSKKIGLMTFVMAPIIADILQTVFYGVALIYVGTLCSLIMIYGHVFTEQMRELDIEKMDNRQKEQQLLLAKQKQQLIDSDLNLATAIQMNMLPKAFPESEAFSMFASMRPAREVGGDFYDFFYVDADHLALVIADVSGKGIPAALYMMVSKTMIKNAASQGMSPKQILEFVNGQLCEASEEVQMFVTVWIGILEISTGTVTAANAGHEYPAIYRRGKGFELFKDRHGFVLGGMAGVRYREYQFNLNPGDLLFVYTDGVTEATNIEEELFGLEKMLAALNSCQDADPEALLEGVRNSIDAFVEDGDQFDDITMMAIRMGEPGMMTKRIQVVPTEESMPEVQAMVEELMEEAEVPMKVAMKMSIVIDEIYSNIIRYSHAKQAEVICRASGEALELVFMDDGIPYNPLEETDPDITLSAEDRAIGGLGIFITKKLMDESSYKFADGKNQLSLVRKLQ